MPVATAESGASAREETIVPSTPPSFAILCSAGVGGVASCALSALIDSRFQSSGFATPSHAASVTRSVGKSAVARAAVHGRSASVSGGVVSAAANGSVDDRDAAVNELVVVAFDFGSATV